jgi:hypothetical protein
MNKHLLIFCCALVVASSAIAQTKTSGTVDCGKADPAYSIQLPDEKDSSYAISQTKCTWLKSFTVAGLQSTQNVQVEFDEQTGASGRATSSGFTQYKNGDKAYWKWSGIFDTKAMTASGTWKYTHGTGKLLGLTGSGKGTCKLKSTESGGGSICEIKGEYTLPAAKK